MTCPECQAENRGAAQFCRGCGAFLGASCPACGAELDRRARFCDKCGAGLSDASRPGTAPRRFLSPLAYTPGHLAERILTSRAALEGERKQVTVLFADIKGSMELLAGRDPEEARQLLDPTLELMMEAVHCYEGTVNQVLGDGIMALFGAPLAHEDHALRACYSALRMQENVARIGALAGAQPAPVEIRVGINSGEVLVRTIASDLDMEYTAVGETTHLAARLQQMAKPGRILCTAAAVRLAEGFLRTSPLGFVPIKGLDAPVEVFELMGAKAPRLRFHVAATRGLTRFVGRQAEHDAIRQACERAAAGHGQVVALVGEPGVGKSRLFWELTHSPLGARWLILEAGAASYGKNIPYFPIIALLSHYFQLEDHDAGDVLRDKIADRLRALDEALIPTLRTFHALLESTVEDPEWLALDPPQRRRHTNGAIQRLLLRESQRQPVMVVVEDLHWIDHESQALLEGLADELSSVRLLLLVNYRSEYAPRWGRKASYTQLRLDPLSVESAEELVRALLGDDPALRTLQAALIDRAGGNPFFLEESVRALAETKVLIGEPGAYRLGKALDRIQIPASVHAVVAARIDRLSAADKRLLQAASVIGPDIPFVLLAAIGEEADEAVQAGLSRLRDAEFLYEKRLYPEREYAFTHAVTHEVVYGGLVHERRKALHRKIVEAIEKVYAARLSDQIDRLAYHAQHGEVWEKALAYSHQAGARAAARSAYREAVAYFEQALAALGHLPETPERLEQAIDLRFQLRNAFLPLAEIRRDLEQLRSAERLARALGDQRRLAWVSAYLARDLSLLGHPNQAIEAATRALGLATEAGDADLQVLTSAYLGSAFYALGDFQRAAEVLRHTLTALPGDRAHERFGLPGPASVFFRAWLVWSLTRLGEFAEGVRWGQETIELAAAIDQPLALAVAHYTFGFLRLDKGDLEWAIASLERSLDLCRTWHLPAWFPNIASSLGYAYALAGRLDEGVSLLEQAVEETAATGVMVRHSIEVAMLGHAHLLAGRTAEAWSLGRRALELAKTHSERGNEAAAFRLLGEVAAQEGPPQPGVAERHFRDGLALAQACAARPLVAACHLGLGRLFQGTGARPSAAEHLGRAVDLYREMEMPFWLAKAEAAFREVGE